MDLPAEARRRLLAAGLAPDAVGPAGPCTRCHQHVWPSHRGSAGGPGRLFDVALKLDYEVNDNWRVGGGYRTLEGGADTDDVYNFGWLHFAVLDIRYQF